MELNKRPGSITVIAWISIVFGGISLIAISFFLFNQIINKSITTFPFDYLLIYLGSLIYIISGNAMLKAQNWARFLFIFWQLVHITLGIVRKTFTSIMIPTVFIFLIIPTFFLLRSPANDYFARREVKGVKSKIITAPEERVKGVRKVTSVICYVISGIFFYITGSLSFLNEP